MIKQIATMSGKGIQAMSKAMEDEELSKEKITKYLELPLAVVEELADSLQTI